jgi:hypothetical protein
MPRLSPIDPPAPVVARLPQKLTMNVIEVASALQCSRRLVYLLIDDGSLAAIDISRKSPLDPDAVRRHRRILTDSVRNFLSSRKTV